MSKTWWKNFLRVDNVLPRRAYWANWVVVVLAILTFVLGGYSTLSAVLSGLVIVLGITVIAGHHYATAKLRRESGQAPPAASESPDESAEQSG
ncbi:hypothetical protein [Aldersonia kunmingensis]|uniref:hypothetical protein n=1 Tax=Aldersonia kunmingensis TaxID=408066 RepID=UPI0008295C9D|nr:hypothetical protein [Aldersonia kunmingensis]